MKPLVICKPSLLRPVILPWVFLASVLFSKFQFQGGLSFPLYIIVHDPSSISPLAEVLCFKYFVFKLFVFVYLNGREEGGRERERKEKIQRLGKNLKSGAWASVSHGGDSLHCLSRTCCLPGRAWSGSCSQKVLPRGMCASQGLLQTPACCFAISNTTA